MSRTFCLLSLLVLLAVTAYPVEAATPAVCEALQTRIRNLDAAIKKTANKEAVARMRTELDRLAREYNARCPQPPSRKGGSPERAMSAPHTVTGQLEEFPEDEIVRRREQIKSKRQGTGGKDSSVRVIPVEGMLLIQGGDASTFYGKVKQEITYTIRETFVGNLIVTRAAGREDYALQTLSAEIDAEEYRGRSCAKHSGSPPVCSKWHAIDLWQIAEGEEYPGRSDGVVSLISDGRALTLRAEAPGIDFGSSLGPASIHNGCGRSFRETVSRDEFKQWLRHSIIRIKREIGRNSSGCRPGSTLTLEIHLGSDL